MLTTSRVKEQPYFVTEEKLKYLPPYLQGVGETLNEVECNTSGVWPDWINGTFIRMGVGRFVVPLSEDGSKPNAVLQHWFDGLAMLHKFRMEDGRVYYTSRYTAEGVVKKAKKNGFVQTLMAGLNANTPLKDAQDPCSALLGAQQSVWIPTSYIGPDEFNVNVVPRRGFHIPTNENPCDKGTPSERPEKEEILVSTDFNMLQIVDGKTLEPKRMLTYAAIDPELEGFGICSHTLKDRHRGEEYNYLINPKTGVLSVFALDIKANPSKLLWKTSIPCRPCYVHSMAMSGNYVIFIRNPISMDLSDTTKGFLQSMVYEPDSPTEFFVLDKSTGKHIASYNLPDNIMFFHSVNGYDYVDPHTNEVNIHIDLCAYSDRVPYNDYYLSNILDPSAPFQDGVLVRYELESVGKVDPTIFTQATTKAAIGGTFLELPRIAKSASMVHGYRYVYGISGHGGPSPGTSVPIGRLGNGLKAVHCSFLSHVTKCDWETGTFREWWPENGESAPCEPIFIQRPGARDEDDGVVLTIVINRQATHSVLVAIDAKTFKEIARADMPQVYALGPHGTFIEGEFGI
ncbi:retinal pigment epithelial membrane family [Fusarium denticulatum]|uniref:Retinal pigment epithelial membrane family n=1 Tax=Fusarium denticulatum TaxID=48507 RepID=A0A8H5XE03_9HYPO|nr:retinal pigment epithelial membrane family [Fusarium denticulatum]